MIKMVKCLRLKRTIIKRFVNDSDDEEVEECHLNHDSDIEIIDKNDCIQSDSSLKSSLCEGSKNDKFTNYKIFVRKCGENVERVVDLTSHQNPFAINDALDSLMACQDLNRMATVLSNSSANSSSDLIHCEDNSRLKSNEDKCETKNSSRNDLNDFEMKVKQLELEGIRHKKKAKKPQVFKCHVCDVIVNGLQLASDHSSGDFHLKKKFGDDLKGMDALFTIDSEAIGDVQIAIARRKQLKKISPNDKQKYLNHGIRLKNGFGQNAYICSKCNISFKSLKEMDNHFKSSETIISDPNICKTDEKLDKKSKTSPNSSKVDQKLYFEGIKATESSDGSKFYCIFCNIYFECKRIAVSHISDTRHTKQRRSENLNQLDSKFTIQSKRIDELEVAFGRKTLLKTISAKTKAELTEQFIRLEDGIGSNAFVCLKCQLPIGTISEIQDHIKALTHNM